MRRVVGLQWAEVTECPWPKSRPRGTKAQGLTYERKVGAKLPDAIHNPWFRFKDKLGLAYCSPDYILWENGYPMVLECKLTDWRGAWDQLTGLYLPVMQWIYDKPAVPIVIVKYASPGVRLVGSLAEAKALAPFQPALHWIGSGPLR